MSGYLTATITLKLRAEGEDEASRTAWHIATDVQGEWPAVVVANVERVEVTR